jgi:RHS repeat-associated protein
MELAPAWKPPPTLKLKARSVSLFSGYGTHAYGGIDSKKHRSFCPAAITRYASLDGSQLVAASDYTYDQYGRPTGLVHHQDPAAPLAAYTWTWEGGGDTVEVVQAGAASGPQFGAGWMLPFGGTVHTNRELEINSLPAHVWTFDTAFIGHLVQTTSTDGTVDYQYDPRGQLLSADYTAGAGLPSSAGAGLPTVPPDEFYTYDANGNRTNPGYITGDHNRLLSDGTYDYEHDAEGKRTRRTEIATGAVTEYHWDHRNRLVRVTTRTTDNRPLTTDTQYAYDYLNRWIARSHDPDGDGPLDFTDTYFVYDGTPPSGSLLDRAAVTMENIGQIVLHFETDAQGDPQLAHRYLWGPAVDQILADEQVTDPTAPANIVWPLTDHLGTVRDLAAYDPDSDTTTIVNHLIYDAYGRITSQTDPDQTTLFAFTARPFDPATNLQNNLNRWYDPKIGRWISEDPIEFEAADANLYRYVENVPTVHVDPTGLEPEPKPNPNKKPWIFDHVHRPGLKAELQDKFGVPHVNPRREPRNPRIHLGTAPGQGTHYPSIPPQGELVGTTACGPCIGLIIVGPPDDEGNVESISVYHFYPTDDPVRTLQRDRPFPPGAKAVLFGGDDTCRNSMGILAAANRYLRNKIPIDGVYNSPGLWVDAEGNYHDFPFEARTRQDDGTRPAKDTGR